VQWPTQASLLVCARLKNISVTKWPSLCQALPVREDKFCYKSHAQKCRGNCGQRPPSFLRTRDWFIIISTVPNGQSLHACSCRVVVRHFQLSTDLRCDPVYLHFSSYCKYTSETIWRNHLAEPFGGTIWRNHLAEPFGGSIWREPFVLIIPRLANQGPDSETCSNLRHSKLLQKSSVSKFVCSVAKYFSSTKFHHSY
jgi:hypothetical protein